MKTTQLNIPNKYLPYVKRFLKLLGRYEKVERMYPPNEAVQPERSYSRDLVPALWHRSLSSRCTMIDIDSVEIRYDHDMEIKCLVEYYNSPTKPEGLKKIYRHMAESFGVKFFMVHYDELFTELDVTLYFEGETHELGKMPEPVFRQLVESDFNV